MKNKKGGPYWKVDKPEDLMKLHERDLDRIGNDLANKVVSALTNNNLPPALCVGVLGMAIAKIGIRCRIPLADLAASMTMYFERIEKGE